MISFRKILAAAAVWSLASCAATPAPDPSETTEVEYDGPMRTVCTQIAETEAGKVTLTYDPQYYKDYPHRILWKKTVSDEKEGSAELSAYWQSGTYRKDFAGRAQFTAFLSPRKTGPKLARVEFHPFAYYYVDWGMRYGMNSIRSDENKYYGNASWVTITDLEKGADDEKMFLRVHKITSDIANQNWPGNAVMNLELPVRTFAMADALVKETVEKGNARMDSGTANCTEEPDPPIIVGSTRRR